MGEVMENVVFNEKNSSENDAEIRCDPWNGGRVGLDESKANAIENGTDRRPKSWNESDDVRGVNVWKVNSAEVRGNV